MRGTVGEFLIERLISNGVEDVFAIPGSLKWYNNFYNSKINVVNTTTEANAGIAADSYARVKGIGCANVTYCVGGFNIANAIACAYAEKSPVVVISGSPGIKDRDEKKLQSHLIGHYECQHRLFERITCANTVLRDPERAGFEIDRVLMAAKEHKQPVYIEVPMDVVGKPIKYDPYTLLTPKASKTDPQNLDEAVTEVLNWLESAKNPVIWAGIECSRYDLGKKLIKFAEHNNIPVATTILGKSVVNERHPLSVGVYCESTSSDEMHEFMQSCDCLIMLGVMMTDINTGFMPVKYKGRNIICATSKELKIRNHSFDDVKFVDFAEALFKTRLPKRNFPSLPKKMENNFVANTDKKIKVNRVFEKINSIIDCNMAIIADIGDSLFGALDLVVHDHHHFISDAFYTSMGFSIPAALGVSVARSNVRPIVIVGDGSFQMTGMEMSTLVKRKSNAIVFLLNNGGYGTERVKNDGQFNDIHNWNYDKLPSIFGGGFGAKVQTEGQLDEAICQALSTTSGPSIINIILDKNDHTDSLHRMLAKKS